MRQIGTQGARRCRAPGLWDLAPLAYWAMHLTMVHEISALKLAIFKLAALQHFLPQHASIEPAPSRTLLQVLGVGRRTGPVERNGTDYVSGKVNYDQAE